MTVEASAACAPFVDGACSDAARESPHCFLTADAGRPASSIDISLPEENCVNLVLARSAYLLDESIHVFSALHTQSEFELLSMSVPLLVHESRGCLRACKAICFIMFQNACLLPCGLAKVNSILICYPFVQCLLLAPDLLVLLKRNVRANSFMVHFRRNSCLSPRQRQPFPEKETT